MGHCEHHVSRRRFIKAAGSATLVAGLGAHIVIPSRVSAQQKTLKILHWNHFVPAFDTWFNDDYVKTWGEQNDTRVIVDNVRLDQP